jgi:glycosyltransferase involved in cell wall biosynthesis
MPAEPSPRAVFGVPAYAKERHVEAALRSLLEQSFADLALIVVDDCSPDATCEVAAGIAAEDARVTVVRNPRRLGLASNWQRALDLSLAAFPEADFFAWGSDHDLWDPNWLASLVAVLEREPRAVLAHPLTSWIDEDGTPLELEVRRFDSRAIDDPLARMRALLAARTAGTIVYGLYRAGVLREAVGFRSVPLADRLLLAELALRGPFAQVEQQLWSRRGGRGGRARQEDAVYPSGKPLRARLPWRYQHLAALIGHLAVRGAGRPEIGRRDGARFALAYFGVFGGFGVRKRVSPARKRVRRVSKRARRGLARLRRLGRRR